jgi:hypothetical protein
LGGRYIPEPIDNLTKLAEYLQDRKCEHIYIQHKNEWEISGDFGIPNYKITMPSIKNKYHDFYKITDVMVYADNDQFLMCRSIYQLEDNDPMRKTCWAIRLVDIRNFNNLGMLLSAMANKDKPSDDEIKQLDDFLAYMNQWVKDSNTTIINGVVTSKGPPPVTLTLGETTHGRVKKGGSIIFSDKMKSDLKDLSLNEQELKNALMKVR